MSGVWSGYVTAKESRYSAYRATPVITEPDGLGYGEDQPVHVPSTGLAFPSRVETATVASFEICTRT